MSDKPDNVVILPVVRRFNAPDPPVKLDNSQPLNFDNCQYPKDSDLKAALALARAFGVAGMSPADVDVIRLCGPCIRSGKGECQDEMCGLYRSENG